MLLRRLTACALVCLLPTSACTSMKTVRPVTAPGQPIYGDLKAGDTVSVETRDGQRQRFVVQQIDGDTIVAPGGQRFAHEEIVKLQRKSFSGPRTAGLVAGVFGGAFLLLAMAAAAALDGFMGAP